MEMTFEITNYCPHECIYCSSNATNDKNIAIYLALEDVKISIEKYGFGVDKINISGGEPLSHPDFYNILTCFYNLIINY